MKYTKYVENVYEMEKMYKQMFNANEATRAPNFELQAWPKSDNSALCYNMGYHNLLCNWSEQIIKSDF